MEMVSGMRFQPFWRAQGQLRSFNLVNLVLSIKLNDASVESHVIVLMEMNTVQSYG